MCGDVKFGADVEKQITLQDLSPEARAALNPVDGYPEHIITPDAEIRVALEKEPVSPFDYRKPTEEQTQRIEVVRALFKDLARAVNNITPTSRSKSEFNTCLETAAMFAVRSIVFEGQPQV